MKQVAHLSVFVSSLGIWYLEVDRLCYLKINIVLKFNSHVKVLEQKKTNTQDTREAYHIPSLSFRGLVKPVVSSWF